MSTLTSPTIVTLQAQLQSARKSLLFMETQHANTLKGLHAEIQNLQKRCSELTFEVSMKEDIQSDGEAKEIIKELKNDVSELTSEKVRMLQLLEEKDRQFVELESHALLQEKKYLNELKVKNHRINALSNELESRSNTISCLTAQLHQARSKLLCLAKQKQTPSVTPVPPNQPKSSSRFHRNSKSADANFRPLSSGPKLSTVRTLRTTDPALIVRPSSASSIPAETLEKLRRPLRRNGPRFSPSPMPDPTPFLNAAELTGVAHARPPSVLPPINKRSVPSQDANGNPACEPTSFPVAKSRDDTHERYRPAEEIAFQRYSAAISPEQDVKGGSTRAPVSDGAGL